MPFKNFNRPLAVLAFVAACGDDIIIPPQPVLAKLAGCVAAGCPGGPTATVEIVDLLTNHRHRPVRFGVGDVTSFALSPDNTTVYGARFDELLVVDAATGGRIAIAPGAGGALAVSHDGAFVYAATTTSFLRLDGATGSMLGAPTPAKANDALGTARLSDDDALLAATFASGAGQGVYLVDTATMAIRARVPVGVGSDCPLAGIAFDGDRALAWSLVCTTIYAVDTARGEVTGAPIIVAGGAGMGGRPGFEVDAANHRAWALAVTRVYEIDLVSNAITAIDLPGIASMIAVGPDGASVFVAIASAIVRYDVETKKLTDPLYSFFVDPGWEQQMVVRGERLPL